MANLYEALQSVNFDGQAVQFLIESQGLTSDFTSNTNETQEDTNASALYEGDLFQCGKCKKQFTSFQLFAVHKKEHTQGHTSKQHNSSILLPCDESRCSASETMYHQLRVDTLGTESLPEINNPIIFSENDILSFAVDQASLGVSTTTKFLGNSTTTRLPSIHCLKKHTKMLKMEETVEGDSVEDLHFEAAVSETANNPCEIFLPDMDTSARSSDSRIGKQMHCEEVCIDSSETVLLNYSSGQTEKSCNNVLYNMEFAAIENHGMEYVGCEVAVESNTEYQNALVDYSIDSVQSGTHCNVNEGEESRLSQPQNITVNKETCFSSLLNPSFATKTSGTERTSRELHMKTQNPENSQSMLKCNFCTKLFTKNFDLQQHIRSHTGEKPFQCVICGRAFAQKSNVKKHMQAHKVWPKYQTTLSRKADQLDGKENNAGTSQIVKAGDPTSVKDVNCPGLQRSYTCQFCDATFSVYIELKSHMKKHSDQKVYKCIQKRCLQTFSDLESFLTHTNNVHVTGLQYCCHICNKKFNSLETLGLHQYSHGTHVKSSNKTLIRGLVCYKCKKKFKSHAALERHLDTSSHHFPCPSCGKVFTWERCLRRHMTTHGPEESYPCPECGKSFKAEPYLKAHMLTHSETRPFVCQQCGATFNRRDKLTRHLLIHQAVKKYKCPFHSYLGCSREFSRQDKLKQHILTHTAPKSVRCKKCSKTFMNLPQLEEHEKLHYHREQRWKCVDCGIVFRSKLLLSSHACSSVYHEDSTKSDATAHSNQNFEDKIKKQKASLSKAKGTRKNSKMGISNEVSDTQHQCKSVSLGDSNRCRGSVSTIEIIVVPVSLSGAKPAENIYEDKNVCIVYPQEETNSVPSELSNSSENLRHYECDNIMLPRRKDCVGKKSRTKNSKNSAQ